MGNKIKNRVGEKNKNKNGSLMEIIEYNRTTDIVIKFEQGHLLRTNYKSFIDGSVKNVYDRIHFGVGYLGKGKYKTTIEGKSTRQYSTWRHMLERCYCDKYHEKFPSYINCHVCDEWHNFQNFAEWYDENYYEIKGERMCLDKDILVKGNKTYSPETCRFIPECINLLFLKRNSKRGDLPIGVHYRKTEKKYAATCSILNKNKGDRSTISLGSFNTPEEAFQAYKYYKENLIKNIANIYKNRVPDEIYIKLLQYKIEIND